MSWIVVGAFLRRVATSVITWLGSLNFWQLLCLSLFCFAALQTVRVSGEKRHSAKVEAQLFKCNQARQADRESYAKAQTEAQAKNLADVAAREARSKQISENSRNAYQNDLARLRADFERRLRLKAAPGATGQSGSPQDGPAPGGADGAAPVCVPAQDILQGAEVELRLLHLQNWVRDQLSAQ